MWSWPCDNDDKHSFCHLRYILGNPLYPYLQFNDSKLLNVLSETESDYRWVSIQHM